MCNSKRLAFDKERENSTTPNKKRSPWRLHRGGLPRRQPRERRHPPPSFVVPRKKETGWTDGASSRIISASPLRWSCALSTSAEIQDVLYWNVVHWYVTGILSAKKNTE